MIPALFQVTFAMIIAGVGAFLFENPLGHLASIPPEGWFAVVWLGLLGSGMAYLLFYRLLGDWGPTRTSLVAYLLPIWGIALGWIVLGEQIGPGIILGHGAGHRRHRPRQREAPDDHRLAVSRRRTTGPEGETQVKPAP